MENYGRLRKSIPKESNSMNKFVREFGKKNELCSAQDLLPPQSTSIGLFPSMSKLSLKRPPQKLAPIFNKENFPRIKKKQLRPSGEIEYLPPPRMKPQLEASQLSQSSKSKMKLYARPERELVVITGSIQFVLKNFKLYPELKALYEVYGNIMKLNKGKIRFEYAIFMRGDSGPVLQGFFFDFENILVKFNASSVVRCIGNFNSQNRFHIHKIEQLETQPQDTELTRIQNVSAFALLQVHDNKFKQ